MFLKVLEFQTKKNQYILDGVTGSVFAVDDIILDCLKLYEQENNFDYVLGILKDKYTDENKIKAAIKFVKKYSEYGAFYINIDNEKRKRNRGSVFNENEVKKILSAGYTQQIILNITENCNMRCKYCYFSDTYKYTNNRNDNMMNAKTAIKALDYFFDIIEQISEFNPGKKCGITFYGGEALLNFSIIKTCIEYSKKVCPVTPIFNITTNGTMLYGDIADYLVENDVYITISLDGSKNQHDRNRIDAIGKGTFDRIINNIKNFKHKYPNYYKINLSSVYDYSTDMEENNKFFTRHKDLPIVGMVTPVVERGTNYYKKFSDQQIDEFVKKFNAVRDEYISNKIDNKAMNSYLEILFDLIIAGVITKLRADDKRLPILPYTSTCIPGMKLFVRTDGRLDICERINGSMSIGDIETGLDIKKVSNIIKKYNKNVTNQCYKCPINRQCGVCFAQLCEDGNFAKPDCEKLIQIYKMALSIAYTILEQNSHAFDNFLYRDEWIFNS